jgi:hypothetical protein
VGLLSTASELPPSQSTIIGAVVCRWVCPALGKLWNDLDNWSERGGSSGIALDWKQWDCSRPEAVGLLSTASELPPGASQLSAIVGVKKHVFQGLLKKIRNVLIGLLQRPQSGQDGIHGLVTLCKERGCKTAVADATSTTYESQNWVVQVSLLGELADSVGILLNSTMLHGRPDRCRARHAP